MAFHTHSLVRTLVLLPMAAASLRRHGQLDTTDNSAGAAAASIATDIRHGDHITSATALVVGVRSAMLEATTTGLNAMGGALVAAIIAMTSLVVLLSLAGMAHREKVPASLSTEAPHRQPRHGFYERRPMPHRPPAACLAGAIKDARPGSGPRSSPPSHRPLPTPSPPSPRAVLQAGPAEGEPGAQQSSDSSASTPGSGPLCPSLVVQKPGGIDLAIAGTCLPYRQTEIVEFKRIDASKDTVARAILSEERDVGGITLQSALGQPVAFMDTRSATSRISQSGPSSSGPVIEVSRISSAGKSPFCTIGWDPAGEGCMMWRVHDPAHSAAAQDLPLLAVRVHGDNGVTNVVDAGNRLLAFTEPRREPGARQMRLLRIADGVDAALIMVAVLAAAKLDGARPRPRR